MEKIVKQSLLYDFYGELLTQHQKQIYEDFVLNNLSFSEIAQEEGISRQGVHDVVKRCDKILEDYEAKLHLVEKFLKTKTKIDQIQQLTQECMKNQNFVHMAEIDRIAKEILEEF